MDDRLLNALRSSKELFWHDHQGVPESEIQRRWILRVSFLTEELTANLTGVGRSATPQKRSVPGTCSFGGPRPSKRPDVGCFPDAFLNFL
jgi:hypothetical protein